MILLQSIIEILTVAMPHTCAQHRSDRTGITVVTVRGDLVGCDHGDHLGRLEECLRGCHIAVLAEHHVDQCAGAIDGAVEITPVPMDFDVGFVDVPAAAGPAVSASPRLSANAGVSLASQSRTASWLNTMPRIRNI